MTKSELVKQLDKLAGKMSDLESHLDDAMDELKNMNRILSDIPEDEIDFTDDEDEIDSHDKVNEDEIKEDKN